MNEKCIILGTIAPPDEQLLSTLLLSHTLKKEGAHTIIALLPYLAYARDDKQKAGQSLATAWVGALLQTSDVDEVITVDVNSSLVQRLAQRTHIGYLLSMFGMPGVAGHNDILYLQYHKPITILISEIERANCADNLFTLSKKYSKLDVGLFFVSTVP